jgi:acetyl esterase/lipase
MGTRTTIAAATLGAGALMVGLTVPVAGQDKKTPPGDKARPFVYAPDTVSPEFQEHLKKLPDPALRQPWPAPDDIEGWKRVHQQRETDLEPRVQRALKQYEPSIVERKLGGVPVLDCKPKGWTESQQLVVYVHGGAYTMASARSSLVKSVPAGDAMGYRIVSVDYTVAPHARWHSRRGTPSRTSPCWATRPAAVWRRAPP